MPRLYGLSKFDSVLPKPKHQNADKNFTCDLIPRYVLSGSVESLHNESTSLSRFPAIKQKDLSITQFVHNEWISWWFRIRDWPDARFTFSFILQISFHLKQGIGVSVINHQPEELLYLTLRDIDIIYMTRAGEQLYEFSVKDIQVSSMLDEVLKNLGNFTQLPRKLRAYIGVASLTWRAVSELIDEPYGYKK